MKIKALHPKGLLDLSSSSVRTEESEIGKLRLVLKPGDIREIDDRFRNLSTIDNAISKGQIKVISYDGSLKSFLMQEENDILTSLKNFSTNIVFSSEASKNATIELKGKNHRIIRFRLYINEDPGTPFFQTANLKFYTSSDRDDDDLIWESDINLVYTELDGSASKLDTSINVNDASDFSELDLFVIIDNEEFRRVQSISSNTITTINALKKNHANNAGVSRVAQGGGFSLFDKNESNNLYVTISFDTSQTVSLKLSGKIV